MSSERPLRFEHIIRPVSAGFLIAVKSKSPERHFNSVKMGVFEKPAFSKGTFAVCKVIADNAACVSIIGGGDSVSAVNKSGMADKMTHISTGGGASLEFLEGKVLPGVAALDEA